MFKEEIQLLHNLPEARIVFGFLFKARQCNYPILIQLSMTSLYCDCIITLHRGAFHQFPFQWIDYYGSNKFTRKETGKTHPCAVCTITGALQSGYQMLSN